MVFNGRSCYLQAAVNVVKCHSSVCEDMFLSFSRPVPVLAPMATAAYCKC